MKEEIIKMARQNKNKKGEEMISDEIRDKSEEVIKFRLKQSKYGKWIFQIGNIDEGTDGWALSDDEVKSLAKLLKEKGF